MTARPSAKQIRDTFDQPTMWGSAKPDAEPVVVFLRALQPARKAA